MVHIKDEGSHFEAPIETVWAFLQAQDAHEESHSKSTRNRDSKPLTENSMILSMERNVNGQWMKEKNRVTMLPPLGLAIEVLEGPLAGSKFVNIYTPKGNRTGIDIIGEFNSSQIPAAQLEHAVRANLETVFNEDSAALKAFSARK
jgi:hypothetical protein